MSKKRKVLTKQNFEDSFEEVFDHINVNSEKNAKKFAKEVEEKMKWIIQNPTAGTPEIKIHSKKNWYRFKIVMKSWKVIYKVTKSFLVFLRIVHIKQDSNKMKELRTNNYK